MRAIGAALTARGVAPERVATEAFGAVAVPTPPASSRPATARRTRPTAPPGTGPAVTFSRSDLAVPWNDDYPSLLDFAEACDVPVGFGCRNGVCHNCESGLLAGEVTLRHRTARAAARGPHPRVLHPPQLRADARPLSVSQFRTRPRSRDSSAL